MEFFSNVVGLMASDTLRFIIFEIALLIISSIFIWIGGRVAQVKKGSFGRAFIAAIALSILTPLLLIPFQGFAIITFILSLIINLGIIKIVFKTNWRKSLITWIFSIIASVIVVVILGFAFIFLLV